MNKIKIKLADFVVKFVGVSRILFIVTAAAWVVVCVACGSLLNVLINFDFSNF